MNLKKTEEELKKHLKKKKLRLYSVCFNKTDKTLTVMLDESLDLKKLETISQDLSEFMDSIDEDFDSYILDVTTVGAERPIVTFDEVIDATGQYVFIKTKNESLYGTLTKVEDEKLYVEYLDKNRKKSSVIDYKDVKQMRYAIKF